MDCKSCGKKLKIDSKIRQQGWVECGECHAIFSVPREDETTRPTAGPQAASAFSNQANPATHSPSMAEQNWSTVGVPGQAVEASKSGATVENQYTGPTSESTNPTGFDIPPTLKDFKAQVKQAGGLQAFAARMQEALLKRMSQGNTPPSGPRRQVELPKGMNANHGDKLVITRTWFGGVTLFLLFFAVIWDAFLMVFIFTSLGEGEGEPLWFLGFHFLAGAFLTYKVVCDFVNRTTITASKDLLELKHGPLWWPGNKQIETRGIKQIYVKKHVSTSSKGGSTVTYSVDAKLADDSSTAFISGLSNADQALYIEQSVESYLGITDEWVDGSYT